MSFEVNSYDEQMMREALMEGAKGIGLTAPNPSVGAVIVRKGKIIGRGYHTAAGKPHAEVEAVANARAKGEEVSGCEIFITLEPCSTTGRTPPCTSLIEKAGIKRVVWAADDPNPAHLGAARKLLESKGIEVVSGVLSKEAEWLHRAFFHVQQTGLPWVLVKTAMSLDGRITRPPEEGQWLTGEEARADVQKIRGEADAIITGGVTARRDNPRLNYRGERSEKSQPLRVVISYQEKAGLSGEAYLLSDGQETRFLKGDLEEILRELAKEGFQMILVEAGGNLVGEFLDRGLVNEWVSYFAPMVTGGPNVGVGGEGIESIEKKLCLENTIYQQIGEDVKLRGIVKK